MKEWHPRCEYCTDPGIVLVNKIGDSNRVFCADCYNRFIKLGRARRDIRIVCVLPAVQIRDIDPLFHKLKATLWGRTVPLTALSFFRSKEEIHERNYVITNAS